MYYKILLRLLAKHFPPHSNVNKIFNRNNVKVSYSCMPSMKPLINSHKSKILLKLQPIHQLRINVIFLKKFLSPHGSQMLDKTSIALDLRNCKEHVYFGSSETTFKKRYGDPKSQKTTPSCLRNIGQ